MSIALVTRNPVPAAFAETITSATPALEAFEFSGDLFPSRLGVNTPLANIIHTATGYRVELAVPGLQLADFVVEIINGMVCISADKRITDDDGGRYLRREYSFYSFSRSFALPHNVKVDKIEACYEKGVLAVSVATSKDFPVEPTVFY